jgi:hypothetical protein
MPKDELLPGVTTATCPPSVACDAKAAIAKARRRAIVRDVIQITLLVGVDYLFLYWPEMRAPFLDRPRSLKLLEATNAAIALHFFLTRMILPRWTAKRIATTWSRAEQQRFTR